MALPPGEHCYYRPARKRDRRYTASDVARIYCKAISQGVAKAEITAAMKTKCEKDAPQDDECSCEEIIDEMADMLDVIELTMEVGSMINPTRKLLKKIKELLLKLKKGEKIPDVKSIEKDIADVKSLEDLASTWEKVKPLMEAQKKITQEKMDAVIAKMPPDVVIKP